MADPVRPSTGPIADSGACAGLDPVNPVDRLADTGVRAGELTGLLKRGEVGTAMRLTRALLTAHPELGLAWFDLARIYRAAGASRDGAAALLRGLILRGFDGPVAQLAFAARVLGRPLADVRGYFTDHAFRSREHEAAAHLVHKAALRSDPAALQNSRHLRALAERLSPVTDARIVTPAPISSLGAGPVHRVPDATIDYDLDGPYVVAGELAIHAADADVPRPDRFGIVRFRRDPEVIRMDRAFLLGHVRNYYHWMVQVVRNLKLYLDRGSELPLLFTGPSPTAAQAELLKRVGVAERVKPAIFIENRIDCAELELTDHVFGQGSGSEGVPADWLKRVFLPNDSGWRDGPKRLFVSRRDAFQKRVGNEPAIARALARHGFTAATLGGLSVADQARLFAGADVVVGAHGAGLTNLLFCRPGTRVIELATDAAAPRREYEELSRRLGLDHALLPGTPVVEARYTLPGTHAALPQHYDVATLIDRIERT